MSDVTLQLPGRRAAARTRARDRRQRRPRRLAAAEDDRPRGSRPRVHEHRVVRRRRSPSSMATRASCATAGYPIEQLAAAVLVPRGVVPAHLRRAADRRRAGRLRGAASAAHDAARGPAPVLRRLPARRAPDAGAVSARSARCRRSTRTRLDPFDPEQVEISTVRLLAKVPTIAAYAYKKTVGQPLPLPRQLAGPHRELPADDLRRAGRARTRSTRSSSGRSTCCSSCTPTTSRTARRRPCASWARRTPTCSRRCRRASTRCSARCTAVPTRPCSRCSTKHPRAAVAASTPSSGR